MTDRGHERHRDDVGAYLLGALGDLERQAFESHLERCVECRAELERLRPAANALPAAVEPISPSPGLRARVVEALRGDAAQGERRGAGPRQAEGPRTPPGGEPTGPVHARPDRAARRPRPLALVAAGLALLLVGTVAGFALAGTLDDGPPAATPPREPARVLAEVDQVRVPGARARLVAGGRGGVPTIEVRGLPEPEGRRIYEVWAQRGDELVPQAVFEVSRTGSATAGVPDGLDGVDAILVTEEPEGGRRAPTGQPILAFRL